MKIKSLIRENDLLVPVEVELNFLPGLPQIQFLGLPDQAIKESIHRIKSALRSQGFQFPKAQQVLVNLRPAHLKKSSRGVELAVALGILWESEQIPLPTEQEILLYGELSLNGEVHEPSDLNEDFEELETVWTGQGVGVPASFQRKVLTDLKSFPEATLIPAQKKKMELVRPQFGMDLVFPQKQAEILKLVALGEHSLLLAGPSGSGKSTMAKTLLSLLAEPSDHDVAEIYKNNKNTSNRLLTWRPFIHPHHTTTPLGLIGGGVPLIPGEISRAHKGVLVLDELLEFNPRSQEVLREPMEDFKISLKRGKYIEEHPAQSLVIATTNLCPCGDWVPKKKVYCGRSLKKCRSYSERLSGPLVDRFQILFFTQKTRSSEEGILGLDILLELEEVRKFRAILSLKDSRFLKLSCHWNLEELRQDLSSFYLNELFPKEMSSRRRDLATLKIARSYADLAMSEKLLPGHVERALEVTYRPFEELKSLAD